MSIKLQAMGLNSDKDKHNLVCYHKGMLSSVNGDPFNKKIRLRCLKEALIGGDKLKADIQKEIDDLNDAS